MTGLNMGDLELTQRPINRGAGNKTSETTVWIEEKAGSNDFYKRKIKQRVPIAIFPSKKPTDVASIPINAN